MRGSARAATFGVREPGVVYRVRPAAYSVILDGERRVACVTEESGLYLPGGGIEPGEDAARALHREVAEECARALEVLAPLGEAIQYYRSARGEAYELRASFFLARFGGVLDHEAQHELHWRPAGPVPPPFFHACHGWAVGLALQKPRDR
jgi:8-oxo-dGTP diphosphatase